MFTEAPLQEARTLAYLKNWGATINERNYSVIEYRPRDITFRDHAPGPSENSDRVHTHTGRLRCVRRTDLEGQERINATSQR